MDKNTDLQLFPGYAIYGPSEILYGNTLFAFDLDHTIIKPTRGTFYKSVGDWEFLAGIDQFLRAIHKICTTDGVKGNIVIFTNQGGIEAGKVTLAEVMARIYSVVTKLGFPVLTFVALSEQYRKPGPLLFHELIYGYMPEFKHGYYIGDASDIESDYSDTDYRFALNCGLKYIDISRFQTLILNDGIIYSLDTFSKLANGYSRFENLERALDSIVSVRVLPRVNVRGYITPGVVMQYPEDNNKVLVITVGPPGCGKTTYTSALASRGWTIISRDTAAKGGHATAAQCLSVLKKTLTGMGQKPCKIVMDATHPDVKSREAFIKLAKKEGLRVCVVIFNVPLDIAKYINKVRCINGGSYVPEIAFGVFAKRYSVPTVAEGIDEIITISQIAQNFESLPDEYLDLYL
jgi:bifunctional polynucleotide phosphatase/kinase